MVTSISASSNVSHLFLVVGGAFIALVIVIVVISISAKSEYYLFLALLVSLDLICLNFSSLLVYQTLLSELFSQLRDDLLGEQLSSLHLLLLSILSHPELHSLLHPHRNELACPIHKLSLREGRFFVSGLWLKLQRLVI